MSEITVADTAATVKTKPTIFVPPRGSMESLFMNGSGPGFSPGPMTMVSSFFAEQSPFSFSQLLAGAMASPMAASSDWEKEDKETNSNDDAKITSESDEGFKRNRPVNLVVSQPNLQMQFESLSPLFMVPSGLSSSVLLNSPGFLSPLQSPFGMSHQQALAHVTAQAVFSQSYMQMQAELQRSSSTAPVESFLNHSSPPSETLTHQTNPIATEPEIIKIKSSEVSHSDAKSDKPASDGYNWRKYGQKHVKASNCPRSYYKCTYINCPVKKIVEQSFDGRISEITYKGHHNHDPPQNNKRGKDIGALDRTVISQVNDVFDPVQMETNRVNEVTNQETIENQRINNSCNDEIQDPAIVLDEGDDDDDNDEPSAKRRIVDIVPPNPTSSNQTVAESKIVVQTRSEVDLLDDGYKWRKYGQKVVKGNPHPRSYYRCTYDGCNVRKHVERASEDPKAVITTYEGKHNHETPAGRYSSNGSAQQLKTAPKSRSLKEIDFGNNDQMPSTLQLKEEQIAA